MNNEQLVNGIPTEEDLDKMEDKLINDVSNDMSQIRPIDVPLPQEDQFENLPSGGGQPAEEPPMGPPDDLAQPAEEEEEMSWNEIEKAPPSIPDGTSDDDLAGLLDG